MEYAMSVSAGHIYATHVMQPKIKRRGTLLKDQQQIFNFADQL